MYFVYLHGVKFRVIEGGLLLGCAITAFQHRIRQERANPSKWPKPVYGLYTPTRPQVVIVPVSATHTREHGTGKGIELMEVICVPDTEVTSNQVRIHPFLITEFELSLEDWCSVVVAPDELEPLTRRTHYVDLCY